MKLVLFVQIIWALPSGLSTDVMADCSSRRCPSSRAPLLSYSATVICFPPNILPESGFVLWIISTHTQTVSVAIRALCWSLVYPGTYLSLNRVLNYPAVSALLPTFMVSLCLRMLSVRKWSPQLTHRHTLTLFWVSMKAYITRDVFTEKIAPHGTHLFLWLNNATYEIVWGGGGVN